MSEDKKKTFVPNSFQTPNGYVDDLMPFLTGEEYKVLIYATRRILGFQKRQDRISLSQFTDGTRSSKDGRILDSGTGICKATVINCLENLVKFGLMVKEGENDPKTNEGTLWSLQWDESLVNWEAIQEAVNKRSKVNAQRMQKARSMRQTAVSGTDRSPSSGTDRAPVSGTDSQNTGVKSSTKTEEEEELKKLFLNASALVFPDVLDLRTLETVKSELSLACIELIEGVYTVSGLPSDRLGYYQDRYKRSFERAFVGLLGDEVEIDFQGSRDALQT